MWHPHQDMVHWNTFWLKLRVSNLPTQKSIPFQKYFHPAYGFNSRVYHVTTHTYVGFRANNKKSFVRRVLRHMYITAQACSRIRFLMPITNIINISILVLITHTNSYSRSRSHRTTNYTHTRDNQFFKCILTRVSDSGRLLEILILFAISPREYNGFTPFTIPHLIAVTVAAVPHSTLSSTIATARCATFHWQLIIPLSITEVIVVAIDNYTVVIVVLFARSRKAGFVVYFRRRRCAGRITRVRRISIWGRCWRFRRKTRFWNAATTTGVTNCPTSGHHGQQGICGSCNRRRWRHCVTRHVILLMITGTIPAAAARWRMVALWQQVILKETTFMFFMHTRLVAGRVVGGITHIVDYQRTLTNFVYKIVGFGENISVAIYPNLKKTTFTWAITEHLELDVTQLLLLVTLSYQRLLISNNPTHWFTTKDREIWYSRTLCTHRCTVYLGFLLISTSARQKNTTFVSHTLRTGDKRKGTPSTKIFFKRPMVINIINTRGSNDARTQPIPDYHNTHRTAIYKCLWEPMTNTGEHGI